MKYGKLYPDGRVGTMIEIRQEEMTSECWMVQFTGLEACENCEFLDTPDCGGQQIRETLANQKGFKVPLTNISEKEKQ